VSPFDPSNNNFELFAIDIFPAISNFWVGLLTPIPTLSEILARVTLVPLRIHAVELMFPFAAAIISSEEFPPIVSRQFPEPSQIFSVALMLPLTRSLSLTKLEFL